MKKSTIKNLFFFVIITFIIFAPMAAYASGLFSTESKGCFTYDEDKDGTPDIRLDAGDIDELSQSGNKNVSDIATLQSKYEDLYSSLNTLQSQAKQQITDSYNNGYTDGLKKQSSQTGTVIYTVVHNHTGNASSGTGCYTNLVSNTPIYGTHVGGSHASDQNVYCQYCGVFMGSPKYEDGHWFTNWNSTSRQTCYSHLTGYSKVYSLTCGHNNGDTWETNDVSNLKEGDSIKAITVTFH